MGQFGGLLSRFKTAGIRILRWHGQDLEYRKWGMYEIA